MVLAVVNLTLIDLPGLTKVAVGMCIFPPFILLVHHQFVGSLCDVNFFTLAEGQPDSVVEDIENMVRSYVDKVEIIISCIYFHDINWICYLQNVKPDM